MGTRRAIIIGYLCLLASVTTLAATTNVTPTGSTNRSAGNHVLAGSSTGQLILKLSSAIRAGKPQKIRTLLLAIRKRGEELSIRAEVRLCAYFIIGDLKRFRLLIQNKPSLAVTSGPHRHYLAMDAFARKDFNSFYRHTIASMESASKQQEGFLYRSIGAIKDRAYTRALGLLEKLDRDNSTTNDMALRLRSYIYLKMEHYPRAYRSIRLLYATKTRVPIKIMDLLFQLALKTHNGIEAVYWSNQILKQNSKLQKNAIFINNRIIALSLKTRKVKTADKKRALTKLLLKTVNGLLKLKRDANALHTASIAYESINMLHKAVEMIRLCRALQPKRKDYLLRQRKLEKALKAQIRKAGRRR